MGMDDEGGILFFLDLAVGLILTVGFWAANNGAIVESLSSTLIGALFAFLFQFGFAVLIWIGLTVAFFMVPGLCRLAGICAGLISVLIMVIII